MQRSHGTLRVRLGHEDGRTRLRELYQAGCLKARLPKDHGRGGVDVALINLSGGLTGGDTTDCRITWDERAVAGVTTQAAEKIYRSSGDVCRIATQLDIADGGHAEWLPQETILFDGARLERRLRIDLAPSASLLAVEPLVLGRKAMGERVRRGSLHDAIELRIGGRLVWQERTRIAPDILSHARRPALLHGLDASATVLAVGRPAATLLTPLRTWLECYDIIAGVTWMQPVLVARLLSADAFALRRALVDVLPRLRHALAGLPPVLPGMWRC